jgi:hypothetical protein
MVMVAVLFGSTRCHDKNMIQLLPETGCTLVALESSSSSLSGAQETMTKAIGGVALKSSSLSSFVSVVQEKESINKTVFVPLLKSSSTPVSQEKDTKASQERALESLSASVAQEKMCKPTVVIALKSSSLSSSVAVVQEKKNNKTVHVPSAMPVSQEKKNLPVLLVQEKKSMPVLQEREAKAPQEERALKKLRRKLIQTILESTSHARGA